MKNLLPILLFCSILLFSFGLGSEYWLKKNCEKAYFEGQKDYMHGDVRIKKDSLGYLDWKKSCWDGQSIQELKYNPKKENSEYVGGF